MPRHAAVLAGFLNLLLLGAVWGQMTSLSAPAGAAQEAQPPPPQRFVIHPQPAPEPALRYLLLPPVYELRPGNAALLYYRAIMLLGNPHEKPWGDKMLREWLETPLDQLDAAAARRDVLQPHQPFLDLLDSAARHERADFVTMQEINEEGVSIILPYPGPLRNAARLLALRIRVEIIQGNFDAALRDLATGFALARHLGQQRTLIDRLVALSIARLMLDQLDQFLQQPEAPNLYWALGYLPDPLIDLQEAMEAERLAQWWLHPGLLGPEQGKPLDPAGIAAVEEMAGKFQAVFNDDTQQPMAMAAALIAQYPAARRWLLDQGLNEEQVEAMPARQAALVYAYHRYRIMRDDLYKWLSGPYWQVASSARRSGQTLTAMAMTGEGKPFIMLLPVLWKAIQGQAELDRRLAVATYREALRLYAAEHGELPAGLADLAPLPLPLDPFTGEPLIYERQAPDRATLFSPGDPEERAGRSAGPQQYEIVLRPVSTSRQAEEGAVIQGMEKQGPGPEPAALDGYEDLARAFVAHLAAGEVDELESMYITREEFKMTFTGENLDQLYDQLRAEYSKSVTALVPPFQGATFLRLDMTFAREPLLAPAGQSFGLLKFARPTPALDNVRVVVRVGDQEKQIKLDAMVRPDGSWRLISPDVAAVR